MKFYLPIILLAGYSCSSSNDIGSVDAKLNQDQAANSVAIDLGNPQKSICNMLQSKKMGLGNTSSESITEFSPGETAYFPIEGPAAIIRYDYKSVDKESFFCDGTNYVFRREKKASFKDLHVEDCDEECGANFDLTAPPVGTYHASNDVDEVTVHSAVLDLAFQENNIYKIDLLVKETSRYEIESYTVGSEGEIEESVENYEDFWGPSFIDFDLTEGVMKTTIVKDAFGSGCDCKVIDSFVDKFNRDDLSQIEALVDTSEITYYVEGDVQGAPTGESIFVDYLDN